MAAVTGERVLGCPSTDTPLDLHATHFVWPGATRRCFALLLASPARRDEALRGERLGSVGLGVGSCESVGWIRTGVGVGVLLICCERRSAMRTCEERLGPFLEGRE